MERKLQPQREVAVKPKNKEEEIEARKILDKQGFRGTGNTNLCDQQIWGFRKKEVSITLGFSKRGKIHECDCRENKKLLNEGYSFISIEELKELISS